MRCKNCGSELMPGASQCSTCGARVDVSNGGFQSNGFAQNNGFGQQNGFYDQNNGFGGQPNYEANQNNFQGGAFGTAPNGAQGFDNNQNWNNQGFNQNQTFNQPTATNAPAFVPLLLIGIFYTICCCNLVFGIAGIILSIIMNNAYKRGDVQAYQKMKNITIIVYVIGVLALVISMVAGLAEWIIGLITSLFA